MDLRQSEFQLYAKERLESAAFITDPADDASHVFLTSLESAVHRFAWTEKARNSKNEPFRIVAGFADVFSPNAFADRMGNTHFIGMHSALLVAIGEFALFCFAQQDFFPELGAPSKETSPTPWDDRVPGLFLIDHTTQGAHIEKQHSQKLIPKDPERYICSHYLMFLMARFVWLHELAHCYNGHVDLVQQNKLALRLYELPTATQLVQKRSHSTADVQTLQCLEFDADRSALWGSVQIQLGQLENIEGIAQLPFETRIRLTLFGSYAMTWLFEQFETYMRSPKNETHPAPLIRLKALFKIVHERLILQHPELNDVNAQALNQFDQVRNRIPSLYASDDLRTMFDQASSDNSLNELQPKLEEMFQVLKAYEYSEK